MMEQLALWEEHCLIEADLKKDPDFDMDEYLALKAIFPERQ